MGSQVFILNSLANYTPRDSREAENICERVTPRLQHANSAVVLGAIKVLMKYMDHIQSQEVVKALCKKMAPPLVTLLSKEPEIQYVALRNINLIIQKRPSILQYEMKVRKYLCLLLLFLLFSFESTYAHTHTHTLSLSSRSMTGVLLQV
jgi:vesicle coat complex subunit